MVEQPTRAPSDLAPGRRRLYEIDLLRFVAALMVVLVHYSFAHARGESELDFAADIGAVTRYGYLGVDLFFMISGLVVFMSLWGRSASAFVISRIARLYPAYWVAVSLTALAVIGLGARGRDTVTLPQYLVNLTMFPALLDIDYVEAVYWTLWSECRFYALLFVFALVGLTIRRTHVFMWGWLASTVLLEALPVPAEATLALLVQPLYSHYFIAGMALYLIHRSGCTRGLVLLLVCSYLNAIYQGIQHAGHRNRTEVAGVDPRVVAIVITVIFLVMILVATGALARWSSPALLPLGEMTYPLYLIHATIGNALFNLLSPGVHRWTLLVGVTVLMCGLSWAISRLVEAPLQPVIRAGLTRAWSSAQGPTAAHRRPATRWTRPRTGAGALAEGRRPVPDPAPAPNVPTASDAARDDVRQLGSP